MFHDAISLGDSFEEQPDGSVITSYATPDLEGAANAALRYGSIDPCYLLYA